MADIILNDIEKHFGDNYVIRKLNLTIKHKEFVTEGLDSAPAAFMGLLKGANFGKQLVRVGPDKA